MKLIKSKVWFDSASHTYHLNGKELSGITSLLDRQLFRDKYQGVPEHILKNAADRGTMVHQSCELADEGFIVEEQEALNYLRLKERYNLEIEESEYLVSDNEHVASSIDKVYRCDDDTFMLGDIKTTYKLNKEYVQWQLSIYAYLFELQNPKATVRSIFAIWLRKEVAELVELERIPSGTVKRLIEVDAAGGQFEENASPDDTMPAYYREMEQTIADLENQLKLLTEQKKALYEGIMKEMVKGGAYSWKGERIQITRKKESIRKTFDKSRFEKDYPELYRSYITESPVAGSLTIKVK